MHCFKVSAILDSESVSNS